MKQWTKKKKMPLVLQTKVRFAKQTKDLQIQ